MDTYVKDNSPLLLFHDMSDHDLMESLLRLPKIDLHRHLTGSIDAGTAIWVAAKYGVSLPTFILSELEDIIAPTNPVRSLKEYFAAWPILNKLFVSPEATRDIVLAVARQAAEDNVVYLELRMGPRGFLGNDRMQFDQFINAVTDAFKEAYDIYGITIKGILGISRHIYDSIPAQTRNRMFTKMISMIRDNWQQDFVGVDLNGDEERGDGSDYKAFYKMAKKHGFGVTIHAGECGPVSNITTAIEVLGADRIGHGFAAASSQEIMERLKIESYPLEVCPTSNQRLGMIEKIVDLPLKAFKDNGVRFIVCTDNPARCKTTMSQELYKIARAFSFSMEDIKELMQESLECSFADDATRKRVQAKLQK